MQNEGHAEETLVKLFGSTSRARTLAFLYGYVGADPPAKRPPGLASEGRGGQGEAGCGRLSKVGVGGFGALELYVVLC